MATDRVFPKKEVGGPSWVTLGPQFAMKARADRAKASLFVSGVAYFL